jgi:hypothetical protein
LHWNSDSGLAIWTLCRYANFRVCRGEVLTTRLTFKLDLHGRKHVQESPMVILGSFTVRQPKNDSGAYENAREVTSDQVRISTC